MKPIRIQRKQTKGWRMPKNTVYVGRPSNWGNLYSIKHHGRTRALEWYTDWLYDLPEENLQDIRQKLGGKNLACWCPLHRPCHADVLLKLANEECS